MLTLEISSTVTFPDRPPAARAGLARIGSELVPCLAQWPPAGQSGDLFEAFVGPSGVSTFFLADVCGNGAEAAPVARRVRRLSRAFLRAELPMRALLGAINDALEMDEAPGCFVCAVAMRVDARKPSLRVARAGHLGPFVLREGGETRCIEGGAGLALGILPDQDYEEEDVELDGGDTVVLATDGITDQFATATDPTGKVQFARWLTRWPGQPWAICHSLLPVRPGFLPGGPGDQGDATVLAVALSGASNRPRFRADSIDDDRSPPWNHEQERSGTS